MKPNPTKQLMIDTVAREIEHLFMDMEQRDNQATQIVEALAIASTQAKAGDNAGAYTIKVSQVRKEFTFHKDNKEKGNLSFTRFIEEVKKLLLNLKDGHTIEDVQISSLMSDAVSSGAIDIIQSKVKTSKRDTS